MDSVIFIAGPTAVGKTKFAIAVAKHFNGEIVSADSMQIYKMMDIGSAKPTKEELAMAKHHLVDVIGPRDSFSVAEYQKLAKQHIREIQQDSKIPIISGGTGLYINSLVYDMDFSVIPRKKGFREKLEKEAIEFGNEYVHDKLRRLDPKSAARIHPNNIKKVIRAIEVVKTTGEGMKEFQESFVKTSDYRCILTCLTRNRAELYDRINKRVDQLVEAGLLNEIKMLLDHGLTEAHISMKGIGYKEMIGHIHGEYSLDEAIEKIKKNTRHYAKRQLTWFRRYDDIKWINISDFESDEGAIDSLCEYIEEKLI
ncbi:MAG: tRNA (adenosine(37)-N6)-dimethylallyltransferase MiaA [Anaerovoracaceae bacterium]|jgi:tRNA dimethylallyltransferase